MQERDEDVDSRELIDLYMQGARTISEAMHRVTVQHDLTPMQAMTLLRVDGDTVPTKDIAKHLHCDPSNATGLVDQLERRGLVRRTTPPHDRRVRAVEATEQGASVLADLWSAMARGDTVLNRLTPADRVELRRILQVLTALAPPSAPPSAPQPAPPAAPTATPPPAAAR